MKKPEKFTEKDAFSRAIDRAVGDFDRLRKGGRWDKGELDEIARSASVEELSYDGFQVDPAIVKAIRAGADGTLPKAYREKAVDDAWKAYSKYA